MWNRYNENQLTEGVLKHGPEIISTVLADLPSIEKYLLRIREEKLDYPIPLDHIDSNNWFMPTEYQTYDIINFLNARVAEETGFEISDLRYMDTPEYARKETELAEFQRRGLVQLLRQMKYIVDTLRKNNIVWGVGRGSSVASYTLYLMGVHRIDSVKYDIPLNEFFKGENNG